MSHVEADLKPLTVQSLSEIDPQPTRWLWHGCVPLSELTIWAGDPSAGKSFLATDLAARVTAGRPMPDGSESDALKDGPGCALILTYDDTLSSTVMGRALAAGADPDRLLVVDGNLAGQNDARRVTTADVEAMLIRAEDFERKTKCPLRLVVLDPMSALIAGEDANSATGLYDKLTPMVAFCRDRRIACLVLAHSGKSQAARAINTISGTQAQSGLARSVWMVVPGEEEDERLFLPAKSSLARMRTGLSFRVDDHAISSLVSPDRAAELGSVLGRTELPKVTWLGDCGLTAQEWIDSRDGEGDSTKTKMAYDTALKCLRSGIVLAADIVAAAENRGVSRRTMQAASKSLGLVTIKTSAGYVWGWPGSTRDEVVSSYFAGGGQGSDRAN
ncbi:MAG: AAA family ATPase [Planctomycetota bacterium]